MYGFRLVLVLIILGGIIAFIGDKIGRRVGRQRLTIFGLRPRYTSVLITILTGIFIAGSTLGILSVVSSDVRTALFAMKMLQATLAQSRETLRLKERELVEKQRLAEQLEQEITIKSRQYEQTLTELVETRKQLSFERDRVERLKELSKPLAEEVERRGRELEQLNQEKARLEKEISELQTSLYFGNLAFRADEIVAATVIQGGRPEEEIRKELLAFLNGPANEAAVKRVGRIEGKETVLQIIPEQLTQVVAALSQTTEPVVVRVVAWSNTLTQNAVPVYFELYRNEKIYHYGEVIAARRVEATWEPERLLEEVLKLLAEVNHRAVQRGMITTPEGTVGQTTGWDDIPTLVNNVKELGGSVEIRAVADADIWTVRGPVEIRLEAVPVNEAQK